MLKKVKKPYERNPTELYQTDDRLFGELITSLQKFTGVSSAR